MSLEAQLKPMKGKLGVYPQDEALWKQAIGMSPAQFYAILTQGLEPKDETYIYVELREGGNGTFEMRSKSLKTAERRFDRYNKTMHLEEIEVHEDHRGQGVGTQMMRNHIALAKAWGLDVIHLRGGRSDGVYFSSRRGAVLEDFPLFKERFCMAVRTNAAKLDLPPEEKAKLDEILSTDKPDMNRRIAREFGEVGKALLDSSNPRMVFLMGDPDINLS